MEELIFATGVVEMKVNGGRIIRFNPADVGFLDTLYSLLGKLEAIQQDEDKKKEKTDDPSKFFDYARLCDKRMRDAVDSVFGEGFSSEVFQELRLFALADGLTVIENFIFAIVDKMDDSVRENMAKRNDRMAKYTAKYRKSRENG
jgi:hypothetical protein